MATSLSIPGKAPVQHEAGDTFVRTITIKIGGVALDLSSATVRVLISPDEDATPIATLAPGSGLVTSNLTGGEIKIFWQTAGILKPGETYWWKVVVTFADGRVKTFIEDEFKTV